MVKDKTMTNPIFDTINNQPAGDTTGLLQLAMQIQLPQMRSRQRDTSLLTLSRMRNKAKTNPKATIPITKPVNSSKPAPNQYGVSDKLYSAVSPYIDRYGLSVIEGYRDPKTASSRSAKNSQHSLGNAIDLDYSRLNPAQRRQLVDSLKSAGLSGFGLGHNTLHVDIGKPRYWFYDEKGNWSADPKYMPSWAGGIF
jgi:hypothetical protein